MPLPVTVIRAWRSAVPILIPSLSICNACLARCGRFCVSRIEVRRPSWGPALLLSDLIVCIKRAGPWPAFFMHRIAAGLIFGYHRTAKPVVQAGGDEIDALTGGNGARV